MDGISDSDLTRKWTDGISDSDLTRKWADGISDSDLGCKLVVWQGQVGMGRVGLVVDALLAGLLLYLLSFPLGFPYLAFVAWCACERPGRREREGRLSACGTQGGNEREGEGGREGGRGGGEREREEE